MNIHFDFWKCFIMFSCCYLKVSRCLFSLINFCTFEASFLHVSIDHRSPRLSIFCFFFSLQESIPVFIFSSAFAQLLRFYCFATFKYIIILHPFHLLFYPFYLSAAPRFLFCVRHTFRHEKTHLHPNFSSCPGLLELWWRNESLRSELLV